MMDPLRLSTTTNSRGSEELLRRLAQTTSGPYLRPFAPVANWRKARVFIVGKNPATPLRDEFESFDAYWDALTRNPLAFEAVYLSQRSGKPSKTTNRARRFEAPLRDIGVLRTNACALPSGSWSELSTAVRREQLELGRQILGALVDICQPAAILAHGKEGVQAISALFSTPLDPYVPLLHQATSASLAPGLAPVQLYAYPHLSGVGVNKGFAVSRMDAELEALGRRLASRLSTAPSN